MKDYERLFMHIKASAQSPARPSHVRSAIHRHYFSTALLYSELYTLQMQ